MDPTLHQLFERLTQSPPHTDAQIAPELGIELDVLRWRLDDLKHRGIIRDPVKAPSGWTWSPWFATGVEADAAAVRSGLAGDTTVRRMPLWSRLRGRA